MLFLFPFATDKCEGWAPRRPSSTRGRYWLLASKYSSGTKTPLSYNFVQIILQNQHVTGLHKNHLAYLQAELFQPLLESNVSTKATEMQREIHFQSHTIHNSAISGASCTPPRREMRKSIKMTAWQHVKSRRPCKMNTKPAWKWNETATPARVSII